MRRKLNTLLDLAQRSHIYNHFDPERYYFDPRTGANANPLSWAAWKDGGTEAILNYEPAPDDGYIQVRRPWMGSEWRVVSEDVDNIIRTQTGNSYHDSHLRGRITNFFLMAPGRYMVLTIEQPPLEASRAYNHSYANTPDRNPTVFTWELRYHSPDSRHRRRVHEGFPYVCTVHGTGHLGATVTKREIEEFLDAQEHELVKEVVLSKPTLVSGAPLECKDFSGWVRSAGDNQPPAGGQAR